MDSVTERLRERLRRVRREALGLNRRNQEYLLRLNRPHLIGLVDHKVQTKDVLRRHGLPVPDTFGHYVRQRQLDDLAREAERHSDFVLKPARGAGGEGVVVIAGRHQQRLLKSSGGTITLGDLLAHAADIIAGAFSLSQARDEAVLEYRLAPEPVLAAYSPGGIPDVRVLVFRGVPVMAMVRLPTRASDGRANLHVGGVGVGLDLASGRAVHAIWRDRAVSLHPDTQQPLSALRVPEWEQILLLAARSYDAIPLGYFGIDIVVDVQLGPAILELNARPGLSIQLANRQGLRQLLEVLSLQSTDKLGAPDRVQLGREIVARRCAA
jgi:alpha-L-glutamate ligase-like protein